MYKNTLAVTQLMKIDEETLCDLFSLMLEGGISYWGDIDFNEDDYKAAKARLIENKVPCIVYEQVLAEILIGGGKLTIVDTEEDECHEFCLGNMERAIAHTAAEFGTDMDDWDAYAGDYLGQMICFGEVIYG